MLDQEYTHTKTPLNMYCHSKKIYIGKYHSLNYVYIKYYLKNTYINQV